MEMLWNLDKLYKSFNDPKLKTDLEKVREMMSGLQKICEVDFANTDNADAKLIDIINKSNGFADLIGNIYSYASLIYSVDTTNMEALGIIEKVEKMLPEIAVIEVQFTRWLTKLENINYTGIIGEHKFSITERLESAKYMLDDKSEMIIATMKNTGSNAWGKLQDTMTSSLTIEFDGKKLPLPAIRNLADDKSQDIRKRAYEAELAAYPEIEKSSAASLNSIKGEVITECEMRGYESPLEMTLINSRMDKETLEAMLSAMKEYLPEFRRYMRKKASMLGHENGLPFYDMAAPMGGADKKYTYEEARNYIVEKFNTFSEELGSFANNAFENNWIDAKMREGKVGGAFCASLHGIGESRIMSNFSGGFSDVTTLAHELGHGFHGDCLNDATNMNSDYPMPLAETASIFCENIVMNAALETATPEETITIIEHSLQEATAVIVDILSRYIFETKLFEMRKDASLSADQLKEIMLEAQKEAYGDGLDQTYLHPYMWACKSHYYEASMNFYNFPYAFGLLFAKGLYARYLEEGDSFVPKYKALLYETGRNDIKGVLATTGVDSADINFWRGSLELIKKDIDTFCNL